MRFWVAYLTLWLVLGLSNARLGEEPTEKAVEGADIPPVEIGGATSRGEESIETGVRVLKRRVDDIFSDRTDDEEVEVMIGYKSDKGRSRAKSAAARHRKKAKSRKRRKRKEKDFDKISAMAITVTMKDLKELELDDDIEYIEPDRKLKMMANIVPYGIKLTQGANAQIARPPNPANAGNCSNPNALRVATIDSGIDASHVDLQCRRNNGVGCVGKSFGISDAWNNDRFSHGTHVAGTIAAIGGNNRGVRGMIADGGICLVIGRVFPNSGGYASSSDILTAVQWAVQNQNANVVSMSLGGPGFSQTESRFYQNLVNAGVVVVAAAGNDGTSTMSYPASYGSVISVAALDSSKTRASFSQFNNQVDVAAPGVDVLSTVPMGTGGLTALSVNGKRSFIMEILGYSSSPAGGVSGPLVDCGLGTSQCPGGSGQICLIKRGGNTFEQKALNCQSGGGKAAVIFNYDTDIVNGILASPTRVTIPAIGASGIDGQTLQSSFLGSVVTVQFETGYASYDGTSMATPHVSGAVASIWRQCRQCSNSQVVQCLKATALDLGPTGYDVQYGNGLIQTKAAYDCLKASCCT